MFKDREDAGEKLAGALEKYKDKQVLVLAIPKGGVQVGYQVAKFLSAQLYILIARKLPFPDEPEAGFGAIAEDGSTFIFENADKYLSKDTIEQIKQKQIEEIQRRIKVLRGGKPLPGIRGKTVILVDDGLAMGSTMQTAIKLCRNKHAKKIIVAVPVSGKDVAVHIGKLADEIVVLETPLFFQAVAQVYKTWYDVPDEEVFEIMKQWTKVLEEREKNIKD